MPDFNDFGLSPQVLRSVREMGFEEPTPVQARALPTLLAGRDTVAQALTGTGKTAAYGIPLVEHLDPHLKRIQAVVLAPTRELALQVDEHLGRLGRNRHLQFLAIYGGQPIDRQLRALSRGVHGIVATPGRLMDHMRRGTVQLDEVRVLVLDEADQMLQMGFQEDVEYIVGNLPQERLTALFSATMPQPILKIVDRFMTDPEMIQLSKPQALTVPSVDQVFYQVPFPRKFDALGSVLDAHDVDRTIVFCSTKRMVDEVADRLPARGYSAQAIHGDITQSGRERVLKAFRDGKTDVLIATDVAARGLDIPDVSLVVNFDIPPDPEYYVHRIGRTGRSGKAGHAVTFVNPREMREMQVIERVTGARIRRGQLPTQEEAREREDRRLEDRLRGVLEGTAWRRYLQAVEDLSTDHDSVEIAAAAIAMAAERRGAGTKTYEAREPNPHADAGGPDAPQKPSRPYQHRPAGGPPKRRARQGPEHARTHPSQYKQSRRKGRAR